MIRKSLFNKKFLGKIYIKFDILINYDMGLKRYKYLKYYNKFY